jgi:hypothetical protein
MNMVVVLELIHIPPRHDLLLIFLCPHIRPASPRNHYLPQWPGSLPLASRATLRYSHPPVCVLSPGKNTTSAASLDSTAARTQKTSRFSDTDSSINRAFSPASPFSLPNRPHRVSAPHRDRYPHSAFMIRETSLPAPTIANAHTPNIFTRILCHEQCSAS